VAQFIGTPTINLLPARVGAGHVVELFGQALPIRVKQAVGSALTLGLRPEAITAAAVGVAARDNQHVLVGRLHRSENLGAEHILHVDLVEPASGALTCKVASEPEALVDSGRRLALLFAPSACHVFDGEGRRIVDADVQRGESGAHAPATGMALQ
jgi:multiple sugar transport system ATP-binding protein